MPECEHFWILDTVEETRGSPGRTIRMHCDKCAQERSLVTLATDVEIAAEFAAQ